MKALVYEGPRKVVVKDMPDARIEQPTDVVVKITTTNICGSDLHMREGRTEGYKNFDEREEGSTKVVLKTAA
ncbi:zinc-containing alcohol dehydrogenase [Caballeronia glebae]|uniref:Zinc-containing alcohol dehydrogenase n=1 Tax=Caballeronia glebae TaxID=1777143 RepID=A0A158AX85_9BURK|nr:zinc-containing alcohol dehydrogenase [Caballeronia glebae]